jgi:hypothetical protein
MTHVLEQFAFPKPMLIYKYICHRTYFTEIHTLNRQHQTQSCAFATEFDQEHDGRPINTTSIVRINIGTMRDLDLAPSTAKQVANVLTMSDFVVFVTSTRSQLVDTRSAPSAGIV